MKNLKIITILAVSLIFTLSAYAQKDNEIIISGTVKNALEKPVSNALIYIDNVKQKAPTNARGFYAVKLKKEPSKIVFFSLQYGTIEIDYVKGMGKINVVYEDKKTTTEVNNTNESNSEIKNSSEYTNIYDYLRGLPGIEINNNTIRIRGISSLNSSTDPLVIINGRQERISRLITISPSSIKSIKVLKNADETAIYGVRGGNGVIVVKTK